MKTYLHGRLLLINSLQKQTHWRNFVIGARRQNNAWQCMKMREKRENEKATEDKKSVEQSWRGGIASSVFDDRSHTF